MKKNLKTGIEAVDLSIERQIQNLARVENLVKIYKDLYGKGRGRRQVHKTDILRAAIVFLHASLEDFLRSLAAIYLPKANEETLNLIPLKGLNSTGRTEKFSLGKLATHRGKSIDEVIGESVAQYLERSNYNNIQDIASLLGSIGIDTEQVNRSFPELDEMIRRRHQIVHRADRIEVKGKGKHYAQSINVAEVDRWVFVTKVFMIDVSSEILRHS